MRHYLTYFDRNYLVKGLTMIRSLQRFEREPYTLFVICFDEYTRLLLSKMQLPSVRLIPIHEIEMGDSKLLETRANRSPVEYLWTTTPTLILRVLEQYPEIEILTYLDADMLFFGPPQAIYDEFEGYSILIHEHRFPERLKEHEQWGIYNVGLLCFRNDRWGLHALRWWRERCIEWCYKTVEDGKFGDQNYLNDWPNRFDRVCVTSNIGVGVAPWNHCQYSFTANSDGQVMVDNTPVIVYHFHDFYYVIPEVAILARNLSYHIPADTLELCYAPYLESLRHSLSLVREFNPKFEFGLQNENIFEEGLALAIHKSALHLLQIESLPYYSEFPLRGQWTCAASSQVRPARSHGALSLIQG